MRIAVVSDIHGNWTAFEAVLADLKHTSPDLILHGGDLADSGSSPRQIVDCIRDLSWPGVIGNTDELLASPKSLQARGLLVPVIEEMAAATRDALGDERLNWLGSLPRVQIHGALALVHASPENPWRCPPSSATDAELETVYAPLAHRVAVHGHIHRSYIRALGLLTVVNTGSVGLPFDGDPRASYLLLEDFVPTIRRVDYSVPRESRALEASHLPYSQWVARMLGTASFLMPE